MVQKTERYSALSYGYRLAGWAVQPAGAEVDCKLGVELCPALWAGAALERAVEPEHKGKERAVQPAGAEGCAAQKASWDIQAALVTISLITQSLFHITETIY